MAQRIDKVWLITETPEGLVLVREARTAEARRRAAVLVLKQEEMDGDQKDGG